MQLRAHAAFASQTNGSMNYPITMPFHVAAASFKLHKSDQEYEMIDAWRISRSGPLLAQRESSYKRH